MAVSYYFSNLTSEVIKMSKIKNILIANEALEAENEKLKEELTYFKARNFSLVKHCQKLASRNQKLECELADMKFSERCLGGA